MSKEIIKRRETLPDTIKGLKKYLDFSEERLCALEAKIRAIRKVADSKKVKFELDRTYEEAFDLAVGIIEAEAHLGKLLINMAQRGERQMDGQPKKERFSKKTVLPTLRDLNITKTQSARAQKLFNNPEKIYELIGKAAREEDKFPRRTEIYKCLMVLDKKPTEDDWLRLYDIWNFVARDERFGLEYPGNIPAGIVLNTLYYFTKKKDLVVDPMAGGGITIDCCKFLNRRCLAYDIESVRKDIKLNDIMKGYPDKAKGCDLIFLDPPYWKKKEEEYGKDSISALNRKEFIKFFGFVAEESLKILKKDGYLALLMEPYVDYENSKNSIWIYDYILEFLRKGWKVERIFDVPETSQRYQAHDVERAKKNKQILTLRRQLVIFRR